ncbi:MAG TPA: glycosyltransferase [Gemmataceae bacterium]|nr:glycosyltransferase [Gemmataceae bacterium]
MSLRDPQHTSEEAPTGSTARRAILLTSYQTGATRGRNLGMPGYSYDLVAQLFVPLLARWGEVIPVARQTEALETAARAALNRGCCPVHVSFVACQDMVFTSSAPNVIVPAWEFPDVPAEAFDGNPRNNWVATANRCDLVLVGGQFTVEAFQRAGIRTPIRIVPVPTPEEYFHLPRWSAENRTRIACPAYVFPHPDVPSHELWDAPEADDPTGSLTEQGARACSLGRAWEDNYELFLPPLFTQAVRFMTTRLGADRWRAYVRNCRRDELELSGVVYTSIFSPRDGRKNWQDLLSGFLFALHDRDDATLLVKLITRERLMVEHVLEFYRTVGLLHRCKVVFITDYLPHEQMLDLVRASSYYLTTTRAEGNCLPLMNYLAAGRPGISPCHTAISDYFGDDIGLTVPWQPEPATWPQDSRARIKTTWARLDWPALVQRLRESYLLARQDRRAYDARAERGQQRMRTRVSVESVWAQLRAALEYLEAIGRQNAAAA